MDHHWPPLIGVEGMHSADHGQHGCGILWHSVVWPRREVELTNFTNLFTRPSLEGGREGGRGERGREGRREEREGWREE